MNSPHIPEYLLAHESATHPKTCFSLPTFFSAVDNDRDFAVELLALLLAQTPAEIQAIGQALERNDLATIGRIIHSQKVSFQVIGLTEVVRLGQVAEALMRANKAGTEVALLITQYSQALNAELALIRTSLQSVL